jgi:hypothetical protein
VKKKRAFGLLILAWLLGTVPVAVYGLPIAHRLFPESGWPRGSLIVAWLVLLPLVSVLGGAVGAVIFAFLGWVFVELLGVDFAKMVDRLTAWERRRKLVLPSKRRLYSAAEIAKIEAEIAELDKQIYGEEGA